MLHKQLRTVKTEAVAVHADLAVLIACHNRKELTLRALGSLERACKHADVRSTVFLADAGSTDGTWEAVSSMFPEVRITSLHKESYWAESMRNSWEHSILEPHSFTLWLNDDVVLEKSAIADLVQWSALHENQAILVGATYESGTHEWSYGGYIRGPWYRRLRLFPVVPNGSFQNVYFGNGNILFSPTHLARKLRGFPKGFRHSFADFFYTGTAKSKGIPVLASPKFLGTCQRNDPSGTFPESLDSRWEQWKALLSPKGLPPGEWARFSLRFGGALGPLYALLPYIRFLLGKPWP